MPYPVKGLLEVYEDMAEIIPCAEAEFQTLKSHNILCAEAELRNLKSWYIPSTEAELRHRVRPKNIPSAEAELKVTAYSLCGSRTVERQVREHAMCGSGTSSHRLF